MYYTTINSRRDFSRSIKAKIKMSATNSRKISELHYDHLQLYVDKLEPIEHYKGIENRLNRFVDFTKSKGIDMSMKSSACGTGRDVTTARQVWTSMVEQESKDSGDNQGGYTVADPTKFVPHGRDLVAQLLYGFGWRVTGSHEGDGTQTLLVTTNDLTGVKFAITAKAVSSDGSSSGTASPAGKHDHFAAHRRSLSPVPWRIARHCGACSTCSKPVSSRASWKIIKPNIRVVLPGSPRSYKVGVVAQAMARRLTSPSMCWRSSRTTQAKPPATRTLVP